MISVLSINNYRSILDLKLPLGRLNLITGPNGSGKSNIYRALRLLSQTATGGVIKALAQEGGLNSTFWAGPETLSKAMITGDAAVEGSVRKKVVRMRLGFSTPELSYSISLGLPTPSRSVFSLDPEIKRECIWTGPCFRPANLVVERVGSIVKVRSSRTWEVVDQHLNVFDSLFSQIGNIKETPEIIYVRESIRNWRFYDHFRSDREAPARKTQIGTRTPVLSNDGDDLAASLQTIKEIGDSEALDAAISDAFPGTELVITQHDGGYLSLGLSQQGLLRPLTCPELSDGTLRYLLLVAALLTPRPPKLLILNEPETSLHPDLIPALAKLILHASEKTQVWVVSHARLLIDILKKYSECHLIELEKQCGQTKVLGQSILEIPSWHWPD
ncbi:AAA family ATPase [Legionella pneumophila serogroup 1]|uniref:AAA family ATPase n=1 Tax=Legionella pneumophila TaxID=446 RepID=UPI0001E3C681|nr:AAA family ATPase [Legionella pneumophila]HAT9038374.1 AAA family ATPase [Legionella pneumophila subsp. pneumophila]TIE29233.1 ATP-binding protein [Legionella pneumophila]TIE50738.1 ATP-binding protein [Legionella pneumophila]WBV72324.1 AAA family ATPase [Legionella pneumophila]CZG80022.1 cytochrome c biogenesis protein CcmA [Legionella pneumophila]